MEGTRYLEKFSFIVMHIQICGFHSHPGSVMAKYGCTSWAISPFHYQQEQLCASCLLILKSSSQSAQSIGSNCVKMFLNRDLCEASVLVVACRCAGSLWWWKSSTDWSGECCHGEADGFSLESSFKHFCPHAKNSKLMQVKGCSLQEQCPHFRQRCFHSRPPWWGGYEFPPTHHIFHLVN